MKIYLSSTLDDLRPHRDAVMDTLRKEGHLLKDSYEATPEPTALQCVQDVESSELYVGVFAWRYGWIPPGQTDGAQLSITEIEYQAAVKAGKPRLVFLATKEDSSYLFLDLDKEADVESIRKLRKALSEGAAQTSNQFKSPDDLALKVSRAVRLQTDREASANAEAQRRERGAPRGESGLMGGSAPPHPQRLSTGLLILGVRVRMTLRWRGCAMPCRPIGRPASAPGCRTTKTNWRRSTNWSRAPAAWRCWSARPGSSGCGNRPGLRPCSTGSTCGSMARSPCS